MPFTSLSSLKSIMMQNAILKSIDYLSNSFVICNNFIFQYSYYKYFHSSFSLMPSGKLNLTRPTSAIVKCDVLVVGASPAGLMAAISAAKGGAGVILLDRDLAGLDHAANTLFEGMAAASGIKVEDCYLKKELEGMRILSPSGQGVTIPAKGYFIDRKKFDERYLSLAQSCGVTLLAGVAKKSRQQGNRRTVSLDDDEIEAKVVVDASGVSSAPGPRSGPAAHAPSRGYRLGHGSRYRASGPG